MTGLTGVGAAGRVLAATGTRTRKVVSEEPFSRSETVRVDAGEPAGPAARSDFELRLTEDALPAGELAGKDKD
jgi:hypothetical protein